MIKKANTYWIVIVFCLLTAITLSQFWQVDQSFTWLCSGRYILDQGVQYDYALSYWLVLDAILIASAYFGIPALIHKVRRGREDITPKVDEALKKFIAFILMCGIGHLIDAANIFAHYYYLVAGWHLATGIVSIDTLITLKRNASYFISLPSRTFFDQYLQVSNEMQYHFKTGFWLFDLEKETLWWSDGAKKMYGKTTAWEPNLEEIDAMVTSRSRDDYQKETGSHRKNGGEYSFEYEICVNGENKTIRANIKEVKSPGGKILRIFGSIQQIGAIPISGSELLDSVSGLSNDRRMTYLQNVLVEIQQGINSIRISNIK